MTFAGRRPIRLSRLGLVLALVAGLALAAPARADVPIQMPARVVDAAGVLTTAQELVLTDAVERLGADRDLHLSVIYVPSFGTQSPRAWGTETEELSEMGYRDLLLAVAVDDRTYYFGSAEPIEGLSSAALEEIGRSAIEPAVRDGRWDEAAENAVDDLNGQSRLGLYLTLGILAVAAGLLLMGVGWFRRRRADDEAQVAADGDSLTVDQLSAQPLQVLDPWSAELLVSTDNAVSVSADELALAVDELGVEPTAAFQSALATAESAVETSFRLRREFDEPAGRSAEQRRELLVRIVRMCSDANSALDEQAPGFDALRDLFSDAPSRLDALDHRMTSTTGRLPEAAAQSSFLAAKFDGPIAASVADNVELARELCLFTTAALAQGRDAVTDSDEPRSRTVAAIRSAEAALDAAGKLLDALVDVGQNLELLEQGADAAARATATVAAAESFVDTRRGAVGYQSRTCLSEAERLLDEAVGRAESADLTAEATTLAERALVLGADDVSAWRAADAESGATVLTGVLVDSVVRTDAPVTVPFDLGAGGFSLDGRAPGSFGGSDTSGRIGTGERR